jgi:hypothetical protein
MMKKLATFEAFNPIQKDMIFEEWRLPTYQDTLKRKLSFLKKEDLLEYEPVATHTIEIKELWRKIMKKIYPNDKAQKYMEIVDNSNVYNLTNTFEVIKKIKDSLTKKEDIGYVFYHDKLNKFFYEKPIDFK